MAAASAAHHVGNSMSDTEQAEFAAAIADCENATVEFCPPGRDQRIHNGKERIKTETMLQKAEDHPSESELYTPRKRTLG